MFHFVDVWRTALGQDRHPVRTDAVEFAALACKRYAVHSPIENYARASMAKQLFFCKLIFRHDWLAG